MAEKFQNRYRISSSRLQNWDYGANGAYFITICTQNRECFFGKVKDKKMQLNNSGQIAENIWFQIPRQFPFSKLGNFIVMPNHIHGIIFIDNYPAAGTGTGVETRLIASLPQSPAPQSSSTGSVPAKTGGITAHKNPMIHDNISRIIRWYKGRCTFEIRKIKSNFGWQSRFYDHIIRNEISLQNISNYIVKNSENWNTDRFS